MVNRRLSIVTLSLLPAFFSLAQARAADDGAEFVGAIAKSSTVQQVGQRLLFPECPAGPQQAAVDVLEVTIRYRWLGVLHVARYQSPGCGEVIDLATGSAHLGCGQRPLPAPRALENHVELTLDSFADGGGFEHTSVRLGANEIAACLLPSCGRSAPSVAVQLLPRKLGHALTITAAEPVAVENHQVVFEIRDGTFALETARRGGGAFRSDETLRCRFDGNVTYRNGRLLFSGRPSQWAVETFGELGSNDGTALEVSLGRGDTAVAWTELDGTYRRSPKHDLQLYFDSTAPDPTSLVRNNLVFRMRKMVERGFKTTVRYLRPKGILELVQRSETSSQEGVTVTKITYRRQQAEREVAALGGEIEVVGLRIDARRFKTALRAPCNDSDALATINSYAFKYPSAGPELLPDAGLVIHGKVVGRLRTDPWYSNLVVARDGTTRIENAQAFFLRNGFDASLEDVVQGTTYVRDGKNQRWQGDNAEVNWRSGIGVRRTAAASEIIVAHTVLPNSNLEAMTAYGRGLTQFEMAEVMVALGADDAMILDGGPSAAFSGAGIVSGGLRELPCCIAIVPRAYENSNPQARHSDRP